MKTGILKKLNQCGDSAHIGGKARNLLFLLSNRCRVPATWVLPWDVFVSHSRRSDIMQHVKAELCRVLDMQKPYAVRSSSSLEDGPSYSHAGIFSTLLDRTGCDSIVEAVEAVWDSANGERLHAYSEKTHTDEESQLMAVMIQEMVQARFSGVLFTLNPVNGRKETIIEAVSGSGDSLVQAGVTPWRWVVRQQRICDAPDNAPVPERLIQDLARQGAHIEKLYGAPVDLEWVFDGRLIYWLQLRALTGVRSVDIYTNRFSREFLPGSIKPLVWSVNSPVVNGAWKRMLAEALGPLDLDVERLGRQFYYRAYFNTGVIGHLFEQVGLSSETLDVLLYGSRHGETILNLRPNISSLKHLPRLLVFLAQKLFCGHTIRDYAARMQQRHEQLAAEQLDGLDDRQLLIRISGFMDTMGENAYYNITAHVMMYAYTYLLKKQLQKIGFEEEVLSVAGAPAEISDFQPTAHLARLHRQFAELDPQTKRKVRESSYDDLYRIAGIDAFRAETSEFMNRFGHLSDSGNDFSRVSWREYPDMLLGMIADFAPPPEVTPGGSPAPRLNRPVFRWLIRRTRDFMVHKEATSYLFTYGYGILRKYCLTLGSRLAAAGHIDRPDDIFYLYLDELRSVVCGEPDTDAAGVIAQRKAEMRDCENKEVPPVIYGDELPPIEKNGNRSLTGIAASGGYYCGRVRVIKGVTDLNRMNKGDVLVIPYADVGLAPLFAKAGAVISESGGVLSHSCIIAREFQIPAVISVHGACDLEDDMLVTVNGFEGTVVVHDMPC